MKKPYSLRIISRFLIGFLLMGAIFTYVTFFHQRHSMDDVLDAYGFQTLAQKEALKDLFLQSSVIPSHQSWENIFPKRSTKEQLAKDLLMLLQKVQTQFVLRSGNKERWEVSPLTWMSKNIDKNFSQLETLGFINAIKPTLSTVDAVCILGSTKNSMQQRLDYAETLLQQGIAAKAVILLSGERFVTQEVDGSLQELQAMGKQLGINDWKQLTETNILAYLYEMAPLHKRALPTYVIDTPKGDLPRPTTQSTLWELVQWLKSHPEIKSILFISNQPYVCYQKAIIQSVLQEKGITLSIDVVGPAASPSSHIQKIAEGLGSYLWAKAPLVLLNMEITLDTKELQEAFQKLYKMHPLIYTILPTLP